PAFPDGSDLDWSGFRPSGSPVTFERDTLVVFDRDEPDGGSGVRVTGGGA
ncbi:MAG: hypothetical protein GWM92_00185, partial [Gemmatimonadetes bacterium]|nr:hypothetical protein [Gemmatimonadota bacterium]NIY37919.1 hypothetical protein [Gemmatimonadota bacterium]